MWTRLKTSTVKTQCYLLQPLIYQQLVWSSTRVVHQSSLTRKNFRSFPIEKTEQLRLQITSTCCHQVKSRCIAKFFSIPTGSVKYTMESWRLRNISSSRTGDCKREEKCARPPWRVQANSGTLWRRNGRCFTVFIHAASLIYTFSFANKVVVQWYHIISAFSIEKQAYEPFDPANSVSISSIISGECSFSMKKTLKTFWPDYVSISSTKRLLHRCLRNKRFHPNSIHPFDRRTPRNYPKCIYLNS